jgi:hypothetical protein
MSKIEIKERKLSENISKIGITSRVVYALVQKPQLDFNREGYENSIGIIVDGEAYLKLQDLGLQHKTRMYGEKKRFIKLKVPASSKETSNVLVIDKDNKPFTELVGDDSLCTITLRLDKLPNGKTKAHLEAVRVLEHKEYVGKNSFGEDKSKFKPTPEEVF